MSKTALVAATLAFGLVLGQPAWAQMKVRVGQPQAGAFEFVPLQVGAATGIFNRHYVDLEVISFGGGARVQQAIAVNAIDIGIGSGPELAFIAEAGRRSASRPSRTRPTRSCSRCPGIRRSRSWTICGA